jgi:hypothetical protein
MTHFGTFIGSKTGRNERMPHLSGIDISAANAGIPRRARFDDGIIGALVFTLFFFLLWLIPVGFRANEVHKFDVLRQQGHEVNGEVTKSYTGRGNVDLSYRFSVDGVFYTGRAKMIADDYKVQSPGEKILIRYLPNNPSVNQPVSWVWFSAWELPYYLLGLGLLTVEAALLVTGWRKRQLARMGVVVEGRVTACQPDRNQFRAYYDFTTEDNASFEGSARVSDECEVGMSIPIIYLRSNPERNDYYPE